MPGVRLIVGLFGASQLETATEHFQTEESRTEQQDGGAGVGHGIVGRGVAVIIDRAGTDVPVAGAIQTEIAIAGVQTIIQVIQTILIERAGPRGGPAVLAAHRAGGAAAEEIAEQQGTIVGRAGSEGERAIRDLAALGITRGREIAAIGAVAAQTRKHRVTGGMSKIRGTQERNDKQFL